MIARLLEAAGRGLWDADDATLDRLQDLYADADDVVEGVSAPAEEARAPVVGR